MLSDGQEILEGRFQIIKKLGSGAFGEIYKGKFTAKQILFVDFWKRDWATQSKAIIQSTAISWGAQLN